MSDDYERIEVITEIAAVAPHLPASLFAEALQAARAIRDEGFHAYALAAFAPFVPQKEQAAVIGDARVLRNNWFRVSASHPSRRGYPQRSSAPFF